MDTIIQDFISGDENAFRRLYDEHVGLMRYMALKYVQEDAIVKDVVQETFISLWEKRRTLKNTSSVKSFLFVGVRNRCLNHLRHDAIRRTHGTSTVSGEDDNFLDKVIETEFIGLLVSIYDELPVEWKEVYKLNLDGKKNEEIARQLGMSVNTVKKYKVRSNQYMRQRAKDILLIVMMLQ